jgi:hypothetical protein
LKETKSISVIYFRDDSYDDKKIITSYGLDGIPYTFVVTPRTAIPYFQSLAHEKKQHPVTDDKGTKSLASLFFNFQSIGCASVLTAAVQDLVRSDLRQAVEGFGSSSGNRRWNGR